MVQLLSLQPTIVITSYSIHYTKLYDGSQNGDDGDDDEELDEGERTLLHSFDLS